MKIYFAGAIRGGRENQELHSKIVAHLQSKGKVLTEHLSDEKLTSAGETWLEEGFIYQRDLDWIEKADVVVAEVTTPSLGVGYEVAVAERLGKKVLCLYRREEGKRLSAMIRGNKRVTVKDYTSYEEAVQAINAFLHSEHE